MSHKNFLHVIIATIAFLISPIALAATEEQGTTHGTFVKPEKPVNQDDWKPHVGAMIGMANPEGNFDSSFNYGLDIGFQPYIPFGVGFELSSGESDRENNGRHEEMRRTLALFRGTYNFGGNLAFIRHSYVGGAAGPVIDGNGPYEGVHIGIAPLVGFDIPLRAETQKALSLGMNAKYLFVNDAAPDTFALNGVVKYWF